MSASLITNIAFYIGVILALIGLRAVIRDFIIRRRKKKSILSCDVKEFNRKVLDYYAKSMKECSELEKRAKEVLNEMCDYSNNIITQNKKFLRKESIDNINASKKQVHDRLTRLTEDLKAQTADVAAGVVKKIISGKDHDDKQSSKTPSRDLSKKLH